MKINIRKAQLHDVDGILAVKAQLPLTYTDGRVTTGGFLLGSKRETYHQYIENEYCLIAEKENTIVGFGIILKDSSLKTSDLWIRRKQAQWNMDISLYEHECVCYFEQLAFLKGHSREVLKLAYNLVCWSFEEGHTHLFTTTVKEPILNLAAVPYILKGSGSKVGNINENYPGIGPINSDIYKVDAATMYPAVAASPLHSFLKSNYIAFK